MNRRSFFRSFFLGIVASYLGVKSTFFPSKSKGIVRPGTRLTKWQPPATAHQIMVFGGRVWWMDATVPSSIFWKEIKEMESLGGEVREDGQALMLSDVQSPEDFTA